jgi:hypothetical protein
VRPGKFPGKLHNELAVVDYGGILEAVDRSQSPSNESTPNFRNGPLFHRAGSLPVATGFNLETLDAVCAPLLERFRETVRMLLFDAGAKCLVCESRVVSHSLVNSCDLA